MRISTAASSPSTDARP
uniref:Uncharacterized protein n=1 Tax=Arundo donax TaxID=35708 RepID=A0A0A9G7H2_ARUDO